MPNNQKNWISFVFKLFFVLVISLQIASPALAVTQELRFTTESGYKIETVFSYDQAKNLGMIREHGHGKTEAIDSMKVSFYNSSGELAANYNNIVDGVVTGNYFEFNFNTTTQQLSGNLDIGGESTGEIYLKGKVDGELSLIEVSELGETEIDTVSQIVN